MRLNRRVTAARGNSETSRISDIISRKMDCPWYANTMETRLESSTRKSEPPAVGTPPLLPAPKPPSASSSPPKVSSSAQTIASEEGAVRYEMACSVCSCTGSTSIAATISAHCHVHSGACGKTMRSESDAARRKYGSSRPHVRMIAQRVKSAKLLPPSISAMSV